MRIVSLVFCVVVILLAIYFAVTDHLDAVFGSGQSRNPPLILVVVLAVIGLVANWKKPY
jgi:heme A synthase